MTHAELVLRAARWLRNTKKCDLVLTEPHCDNRRCAEQPDAIGWDAHVSILVECKTSWADLCADHRKPHRGISGLGRYRYYMIPQGLDVGTIPEPWGLLDCRLRMVRVVKAAARVSGWNAQGEIAMLARMLYWALERAGEVKEKQNHA